MKWIKASERLPDIEFRDYAVRKNDTMKIASFTKKFGWEFNHNGKIAVAPFSYEWLDESPDSDGWIGFKDSEPEKDEWILYTWAGNEVPSILCFKGNSQGMDSHLVLWDIDPEDFWRKLPLPPNK